MKKSKLLTVAATFIALFGLNHAKADQLDDIRARGVFVCGTVDSSEPFSFLDKQTRAPIGYDIDFCNLIAKGLGVKVEYKLLSIPSRIPELTSGGVDILVADMTYNKERSEQVDFSGSYFVTYMKLLVRADSPYQTPDEVNGKRIGSVKGSTSEREVTRIMDRSQIIGYNDPASTYLALQQGKVEAMFLSEMLLARFALQASPEAPMRILDKGLVREPWGICVRKGEPALLNAVNTILDDAEKDGTAAAIYDKWVGAQSAYKMTRDFQIRPIEN